MKDETVPNDKSKDWIKLKYIGETYEIMDGILFEHGTESGLPKDIWETLKDKDIIKGYWIEI